MSHHDFLLLLLLYKFHNSRHQVFVGQNEVILRNNRLARVILALNCIFVLNVIPVFVLRKRKRAGPTLERKLELRWLGFLNLRG
jgi:hypothetical protein